ncbi:MAG: tRNA (guanosine(46)-N7)-methyltransferase TrmB [Gammaproteobacteria bacterium]|nr:tRNA (guanosine(46)-N7)-methyltransferase TrmB [Gammaproteobacteria bacterium]
MRLHLRRLMGRFYSQKVTVLVQAEEDKLFAEHPKSIRSFVRRSGRMTKAQKEAFECHWETYGLDVEVCSLNFFHIFGNQFPVWLEVGFGNGDVLLEMATANPDINFIGIDVYKPGVGRLLKNIAALELSNVKVICDDAVTVLQSAIEPGSLDRVLVFFPDPWPKKKHHKRRLVSLDFVHLLSERIAPSGTLHLATDWEEYAYQMVEVIDRSGNFVNTGAASGFADRPAYRPETHFERRGARLGHGIWDVLYKRKPA